MSVRPRGRGGLVTLVALAAWAIALGAWLVRDRGARTLAFPDGSVAAHGGRGLRVAHDYLAERRAASGGPPVRRLLRPVRQEPLERDAVIVRVLSDAGSIARLEETVAQAMDPEAPPPDRAPFEPAELAWIAAGGRLVVGLVGSASIPGVSTVELDGADARPVKTHPAWPSVRDLRCPVPRTLDGPLLRGSHALFAAGEQPVVARLPIGQGDVLLLACPETLFDDHVLEADHAALLEAMACGRPAWFDEHVHGVSADDGAMEVLRRAHLGPSLLLAALGALAWAWRAAVRVGPAEEPHRERRTDAGDLVDSLARLYRGALTRREALRLHVASLEREIGLREKLRGPRLRARVDALLGRASLPLPGRHDLTERELQRALERVNTSFRETSS